jgi:uncharacterized protein
MLKLIEDKITELQHLCKKYDVNTMYLFGSALTDSFTDTSDVDILISFKDLTIEKYTDNYFQLHEELEKLLNQKVDLLTLRSISNPYFRESIEQTKQLLYAA